jgi:hypothetical protein
MAVMEKRRAEAFSDGVLAVAITLLVLDLHVEATGHGSLSHQLAQTWPSFAAYFVSFFVIGVIWVNHHALFALIDRVDRVLLFENLTLLMFVTTLPFTTSTLATFVREGGAKRTLGSRALRHLKHRYGVRLHCNAESHRAPRPAGGPGYARGRKRAVRRFGLGTIAYQVAAAAGLFWPPLILIAIGLLAVYYMAEQTQILPNADRAELSTEGG